MFEKETDYSLGKKDIRYYEIKSGINLQQAKENRDFNILLDAFNLFNIAS